VSVPVSGFEVAIPGPWGWKIPLFDWLFLFFLICLYSFIASALVRFLFIWKQLRLILRRLERTSLRHAFDRLPKKFYSWTPLWYAGGSRKSLAILTRSLECLRKLHAEHQHPLHLGSFVHSSEVSVLAVLMEESASSTYVAIANDAAENDLAAAADYVLGSYLIPSWIHAGDCESLDYHDQELAKKPGSKQLFNINQTSQIPPNPAEALIVAEEFVALRFVDLIRYAGLQLRSLLSFVSTAFILSVLGLRTYPFLAHRTIGWILTLIFVALGSAVIVVFAQMDRDALLSRITDTQPGKLDREFYFRLLSYGALPLLTILASQFPAVGKFLFSWIQPAAEALH
jgi:hypothetical protein